MHHKIKLKQQPHVQKEKNYVFVQIKQEVKGMPTFNQLVRKGRQTSEKKINCTCSAKRI